MFYPAPLPLTPGEFRAGIFHAGKDKFECALFHDSFSGSLAVFPECRVQVITGYMS
jgi:hypothetical protein